MCSSILSQQVSSRFVIWDQLRSKINLSPTIANQPGIAAVPAPQEILLCLPHTWLSPIRMGNEWIVTDSWLWIVPAKHGEWTRRLWLENLKTTFTVKLQLHYFNKKKKGEKKKICSLSHLIHLRFDSTIHQEASSCSLSIRISTTHVIQASLWV